MNVELGIQNVSQSINFETEQTTDDIRITINHALTSHEPICLTDKHNRQIIVPSNALAYALVGQEPKHTVGFGV